MSSIATMYSFSRQFGLKYYVTQEQYDLLTYYFQPSTLDLVVVDVALANLSTLGVYLSKIYHTVNRLRSFLSSGHLIIWSFCHVVILSSGHPVILIIQIFVLTLLTN